MSIRNFPIVIAALSMALAVPLTAEAAKSCKQDIDCSGEQVCQKKRCVSPKKSARRCVNDLGCDGNMMCEGGRCVAPAKSSRRCASDVACPGNQICEKGRCVTPSGPAIMPHGVRVEKSPEPVEPPEEEPPPHPMPPPEAQPAPEPAPEPAPQPETTPAPAPASPKLAPAPAPPPPAGDRPTEKAKPGIITGLVFDIIGFGFFIGGGAAVSFNLGVGLALGYAGGAFMTVGSTVSTASFTVRHKAYVDAGFDPPGGRRVGAWVLTSLTIGMFAGGLGTGLAATLDGPLPYVSIGLNGTAVILEVINYLVRSKWDLQLRESAALRNFTISPVIASTRDPLTGERAPVVGFAGSF